MPSNGHRELLHAVNRYLHNADRYARRARRMKWALIAGSVIMGVWAFLMLLSLP